MLQVKLSQWGHETDIFSIVGWQFKLVSKSFTTSEKISKPLKNLSKQLKTDSETITILSPYGGWQFYNTKYILTALYNNEREFNLNT